MKTKVIIDGGLDIDGSVGYIDGYFTEPTTEDEPPSVWAIIIVNKEIVALPIEDLRVIE